jgi:hypothetical protein
VSRPGTQPAAAEVLAQLAAAGCALWYSLTPTQQQAARMWLLRAASRRCWQVAFWAGRMAVKAELGYSRAGA